MSGGARKAEADAAGGGLHPLTLAVVRHKLLAVAEESVEAMVRTCFSSLLNQAHDFSAVILDAGARVVAQAERVPIHMGAMPFAVRAMAEAFAGDIAEGDVLMANDPYWGGSHLPDITLARPVFDGGRVRFWVANRAHQGDIGGLSAGSFSPKAREIWHEGIRIPPVKFVEGGRVREDLLRLIVENTRKPEDTRGDIMAQLASVTVGTRRLDDLFARYGAEVVAEATAAILDAGEAAMRAEIRRWKPGTYMGVTLLDDDGCGNRRVPIRARVTLAGDEAVVDLRDNPDQVPSFMNSPIANTVSAVNTAFMYLSENKQTQNEGSSRAIRVLTRKSSMLDCTPPAPSAGSTLLVGHAIIEAVLLAMAEAAPEHVFAGPARRFRFALAGPGRDGRPMIWHLFSNRGGAGASKAEDGWPNLGTLQNPGGTTCPSVERTEADFPLFVESYALSPDSGGAGLRRGGLGGLYVLRYEGPAEAVVNTAGEGVEVAPPGVAGGRPGSPHDYRIRRGAGDEVRLGIRESGVRVRPGDRIVCRSAGGGGYGEARRRERSLVRRDLDYGYISAPAARDAYGFEG